MKWPCVSRSAYDVVEAAWCQEHDHVLDLQKRFDTLLDKYHALKIEGAVTVPDYGHIEPPLTVDEQDALRAQEDDGN
jgi:hypothetical protein